MKSKYIISLFLITFFCSTSVNIYSQQSRIRAFPFINSADSKSSAMGFTSVSNPFSPLSYKENSANLSYDNDVNLYIGGNDDRNAIFSSSAIIHGFGIAFDYSVGDALDRIIASHFNTDLSESDYDYFAFSVSKEILNHLSVGGALTFFRYYEDHSFKLDFGALFTVQNLIENEFIPNELFPGISLKNIGPDIDSFVDGIYLPRYLTLGATYKVTSTDSSLFAYSFETSVEYKNYLNPGNEEAKYYYDVNEENGYYKIDEGSKRDFWGIGFELTLFKAIAIRDGFYKSPFQESFVHTGGIGIHFPPKVSRFSVSFEYMRFWDYRYYFGMGKLYNTSINLSYRLD